MLDKWVLIETGKSVVTFCEQTGTVLIEQRHRTVDFSVGHIFANCVAPGPIGTALTPSTMDADSAKNCGAQVPMIAPTYVMLASDEASY